MHATIQKPVSEIISHLREGEKLFVVGCDNCAAKCRSGGVPETKAMAEKLRAEGVDVVDWAVPGPSGVSLCKLSNTEKFLREKHGKSLDEADSFLVLSCGQGVHTVLSATGGKVVHPGCDTVFGGETTDDNLIKEYCSLCGECIIEYTGGLCPLTLCAKGLLNGPCGGAKDGKCEISSEQDCGWQLIYERLKAIGRLDLMYGYREPKNNLKWGRPRTLALNGHRASLRAAGELTTNLNTGQGV